MDPEFGVGIRRYLFELAESDVQDTIRFRISSKLTNIYQWCKYFKLILEKDQTIQPTE